MPDPHLTALNPLLAEVEHCPRCAAPQVAVTMPRRLDCPACGLVAFFNPKPVAAAIPVDDSGRVILLRRAPGPPGAGLWTFPGGFVDLGESVEDAARREVREELEMDVELGGLVGVYSRADDRIVLVVYRARALGEPSTTPEATEVAAFAPEAIPWGELAFWSTERALREFVGEP